MARRASGLSVAALLSSAISFPATLLAARWLGPTDFGRAQYVLLFYSYGALIRSGVFEGGMRDFMHLQGRDPRNAVRSQNVGFSYELAVSVFPGIVLAAAAAWSHDPVQRLGFVVAPIAVVASSAAAFFGGMCLAREQFQMVSRITIVRSLVFVASLLAGVQMFGAVGAVLAPAIADLLTVVIYALRSRALELQLSFERALGWALTKAGFPLGALAIVYWAYRLAGSTSVALALPATALGIYVFAAAPIALLLKALSSIQAVLTPSLWREMGRGTGGRWVDDAARVAVASAALAAVATNLAQAGFAPIVSGYLPHFAQSIVLFEVLAMNVLLLSLDLVPSLVLNSAAVNSQATHLTIWLGGLLLNIAANAFVLLHGMGVMAVVWNDLWVQVVVVVSVHAVAARHLPGDRWRGARRRMAAVAATASLIALALHFAPQDAEGFNGLLGVSTMAFARLLFVAAAWGIVALPLVNWARSGRGHRPKAHS